MSVAGELEDGEIDDSDEETTAELSAITNAEVLKEAAAVQPPRPPVVTQYRNSRKNDSSEEGSSSGDSTDDDDCPQPNKAKKNKSSTGAMDVSAPHKDMSHNHGNLFKKAASAFQKSRSREMWSSVAQDYVINETMAQISGAVKEKNFSRGVESYNIAIHRPQADYADDMFDENVDENGTPKEDKMDSCEDRQPQRQSPVMFTNLSSVSGENKYNSDGEPTASICDIESFGTNTRKAKKRTIKDRLGKRTHSSRSNSPEGGDKQRSCHERLGSKNFQPCHHKATFDLTATDSDPPETVADKLIEALGEPEYQTELLFRAVSHLGVKKALEIYYMTENIEENGGMLIVNGQRRRSPGGVYLQLVKTEGNLSKEQMQLVFPPDRWGEKRKRNNRRNRNKQQQRQEHTGAEMDLEELPSKADVLLASTKPTETSELQTENLDPQRENADRAPGNDSATTESGHAGHLNKQEEDPSHLDLGEDFETDCVDIELDLA